MSRKYWVLFLVTAALVTAALVTVYLIQLKSGHESGAPTIAAKKGESSGQEPSLSRAPASVPTDVKPSSAVSDVDGLGTATDGAPQTAAQAVPQPDAGQPKGTDMPSPTESLGTSRPVAPGQLSVQEGTAATLPTVGQPGSPPIIKPQTIPTGKVPGSAVAHAPKSTKTDSGPAKPSFPGINQNSGEIMVSRVRYKPADSEDIVTVTLTRVEGQGDVDGTLWVIGEYVQRGTTGVMYMPSHPELKVGTDGQPKSPHVGVKFQMRIAVEKNLVVKRPGFEGEELAAVRVGVVNKSNGKIHMARVLTKQLNKKNVVKRAKVADQ